MYLTPDVYTATVAHWCFDHDIHSRENRIGNHLIPPVNQPTRQTGGEQSSLWGPLADWANSMSVSSSGPLWKLCVAARVLLWCVLLKCIWRDSSSLCHNFICHNTHGAILSDCECFFKGSLGINAAAVKDTLPYSGFGSFTFGLKMWVRPCTVENLQGWVVSSFQHWLLLFHRPAHPIHNLIDHGSVIFLSHGSLEGQVQSCIQWQRLSLMSTFIFLALCLFYAVCVSAGVGGEMGCWHIKKINACTYEYE